MVFLNGTLYVPYGGKYVDCGAYHGWLVAFPTNNPSAPTAWATAATGGGSWSCGGVTTDGTDLFIATGNTFGASTWSGGEAIIRLHQGASFSGSTADYWTPSNWKQLDTSDLDLGGSGPLPVDVPGATPSQLVLALGKDGNGYLLNRSNLGGVSAPLSQLHLSTTSIIQAAATYRTAMGTYVVFMDGSDLTSFLITPSNPPAMSVAWSASQNGRGSPFVTSTDGTNNVIVWGIGCEGDQKLHGFDGDTGNVVFSGGTLADAMSGTRHMNTAIVAQGRIFVAADNEVYAFTLPPSPPVITVQPTNQTVAVGGQVQFLAAASGTAPLSYQWFFETNAVSGATNATLTLTNVQLAQAGPYALVVSNQLGGATTSSARLAVLKAPVISKVSLNGTTISVTFDSLLGPHYLLEYTDSLAAPVWTSLTQIVSGSGAPLTLTDTNAVPAARFYRVRSF